MEQDAHSITSRCAAGLGGLTARLAGSGGMIQITPQMRVLVAIEPVDGARALTLSRGFARTSSPKILFPAACSCSGVAAEQPSVYSPTMGKDTGYFKNGYRRAFPVVAGRKRASRPLEAYEAQLLLAAGDVSRVRAAPMWRRVSALK